LYEHHLEIAVEALFTAKNIPKKLMEKREMVDNGEYREESGG